MRILRNTNLSPFDFFNGLFLGYFERIKMRNRFYNGKEERHRGNGGDQRRRMKGKDASNDLQ